MYNFSFGSKPHNNLHYDLIEKIKEKDQKLFDKLNEDREAELKRRLAQMNS